MKSANLVKKTVFLILLELLLIFVLGIASLFIVSYIRVNLVVFDELAILSNATGWDKFWMWMYLFGDCLYFIVLSLMFLELVLFLLRTIAKILFNYLGFVTGRDMAKWLASVKLISLISIFRKLKINTTKRGLIVYFAVIVYTFGSPFIAEKILDSRDSLIYRAHELVNLYEESETVDMTASINAELVYDIRIQTGVGNIHVYAIDDTQEATIHFFFDNQEQLDTYTLTINAETGIIDIQFNVDQLTYAIYQEPVMPSVELYLPESLLIGDITTIIGSKGNFVINYVMFQSLDLSIASGQADITSDFIFEHEVKITAIDSNIAVKLKSAQSFELISLRSNANLRLFDVTDTVTLDIQDHSDVFLYSCLTDQINVDIVDSNAEFRELYANDSIDIIVTSSTFIYLNSRENDPIGTVSIIEVDSITKIDGVPLD